MSQMLQPPGPASAWGDLVRACDDLPFPPHDIAALLDARGRYDLPLDDEYAFTISLFHYSSRQHTRGSTWHERLELFVPLDAPTVFRMGDHDATLRPGDLLVVDNLTPHHVVDFEGFDTRAIVVTFRPEFVYSLGSPSYDYAFLLPFHARATRGARVLSLPDHDEACHALRRLVTCRFGQPDGPLSRAGCKAFLLLLLFELGRQFPAAERQHVEFLRQQQRSHRLKVLFEHLQEHYAERLTVATAAAMVGMSAPVFMKVFKQVAGMTLVAYLNHVRLAHGSRLLRETDRTIADIASAAGFADQSYFDRRFKRAFGRTPKEFRNAPQAQAPPGLRSSGENRPTSRVRPPSRGGTRDIA
jgi:AraC-like DNA-binding protein